MVPLLIDTMKTKLPIMKEQEVVRTIMMMSMLRTLTPSSLDCRIYCKKQSKHDIIKIND